MRIPKQLILLAILLIGTSSKVNALTYYVSFTSGNDNNSGTITSLPWKTINRVNIATFNPGDSILFKRNETWRGQLVPSSGTSSGDIYYGAYFSGNKPIILGSMDYNNNTDWIDQGANIWKCNTVFTTDIGNIIFDNATSVGIKKWSFIGLQNQDDFWYNLMTGELEIYSTSNPAIVHSEIELALRKNIINQENKGFITYENLSLKYGGAHGIGGGNTTHITVTSCEISYIGGGDLNMDGTIRFGNGIEFWGNASNHIVERCKIGEIYDTGLTNQNHTSTVTQRNIKYRNNILWNCGLSSFEYWNRPSSSTTAEIYFENNTCLYAGSGWGAQRPDYHGIHVLIDNNTAQTDTIYIRNNIFHIAQRSTYAVEDNINGFIKLNYNLINQARASDTLFVSFPSILVYTFGSFVTYSSSTGKDVNSLTGIPQFVNQTGLDFKLTNLSPCIDNGTNVDIADDFDGNPRPLLGGYDIGAYEYNNSLSIQYKDQETLLSVFPNPAFEYFKVSYGDNIGTLSELYLFNSLGQIVHTVKNFNSKDKIDISDLPYGFYSVVIKLEMGKILTSKLQIF
jgi:hypothetical protein